MNKIGNNVFIFLLVFLAPVVNAEAAPENLHDLFNRVLRENVTDGKVNYPGIKNDARFNAYLTILKQTDPGSFATQAEKLAFWINAYNALAIKGILDGLSPASLFGRLRYFKLTKYDVAGKSLTLYDLERNVIIPFNDPRIHFAIVCASASCPKLRSEAYVADRLEEQLDDGAKDFINDAHKNRFDVENKTAELSKIFDWFKTDFNQHAGSVQHYIKQYLADPVLREEAANETFRISYMKYDWSLNGIPVN